MGKLQLFTGFLVFFATTKITVRTAQVSQVSDTFATTSSAYWDDYTQRLYFVAELELKIGAYHYEDQSVHTIKFHRLPAFVVPTYEENVLIVGFKTWDICKVTWDGKSAEYESNEVLIKGNQPENLVPTQARTDVNGRIFVGSRNEDGPGGAKVFMIDLEAKELIPVIEGFTYANPMAWTWPWTNDKFYISDTFEQKLYIFNYDPDTQTFSNRRVFIDVADVAPALYPSAHAVDLSENLHAGGLNSSDIVTIDAKTAEVIEAIELPVKHVTSIVFGGPQLEHLFITTTRRFMDIPDDSNEAGSILMISDSKERGYPLGYPSIPEDDS